MNTVYALILAVCLLCGCTASTPLFVNVPCSNRDVADIASISAKYGFVVVSKDSKAGLVAVERIDASFGTSFTNMLSFEIKGDTIRILPRTTIRQGTNTNVSYLGEDVGAAVYREPYLPIIQELRAGCGGARK